MYRRNSERIGTSPVRTQKDKRVKCCNICGHTFQAQSLFQRFCYRCRRDEEMLRFVEWLPEAGNSFVSRISA